MKMALTKPELAAQYSVTVRTVTNWMRARRVPYLKIGRIVRFDSDQVRAQLEKSGLVK
jgi:excisionase family DNA binding protein